MLEHHEKNIIDTIKSLMDDTKYRKQIYISNKYLLIPFLYHKRCLSKNTEIIKQYEEDYNNYENMCSIGRKQYEAFIFGMFFRYCKDINRIKECTDMIFYNKHINNCEQYVEILERINYNTNDQYHIDLFKAIKEYTSDENIKSYIESIINITYSNRGIIPIKKIIDKTSIIIYELNITIKKYKELQAGFPEFSRIKGEIIKFNNSSLLFEKSY